MDLCGPIHVASVNGKKCILVIVNDYSRFAWVKFLRSKVEAPDFIIKFFKMIQLRLKVPVRRIRTYNGTEFVNQTLREYYEKAEVVATACCTQNRSIIRLRHDKTPYELLHDKLPDLSFFHVFGALCYPMNDRLVPNPPPSTLFIPPSRTDWDMLFQPLFDELLNPETTVSTGSPSSTTVDQDAPSPIAHMGNDSYFGIPIPEVPSDQSSSSDSIHTNVSPDHQIFEHNNKWNKDHPLENIIGELARPVSTRLQLYEQALFCYYDAFLTAVEPNMYKDALTQACWIDATQEELNEFERARTPAR
ncbi:retrovirus-related pol polyprotein from transposon TNT 1-94 [Tanacetum coccineum]